MCPYVFLRQDVNTEQEPEQGLVGECPGFREEEVLGSFFLPPLLPQMTTRNDMKHNNAWIEAAKNREKWRIMENDHAKTAAERSTDNAARRGNFAQDRSRPARYLNGVRLDDNEAANHIT